MKNKIPFRVFFHSSFKAYMEYTANLGLFAVHKVVSEYAERIYAHMERTPRDTKLGNLSY
jgi:hypothetical protein